MKKTLAILGLVVLLGAGLTSCKKQCVCALKLNGTTISTHDYGKISKSDCDIIDGTGESYGGYTAEWDCN